MIITKQKEATILVEGEIQSTIKSTLDLESTDFIMQMLTKGFYSDEIGSTIRETTSNAVDSHRKAGIDDPVIVSLVQENGKYNFTVEDFGLGLDHETVLEVISKYGKSTKRDDANAIGAMGLGWKSPLSYSSSFYFVTRKDGVERKYMQSESEEGGSDIDLLYETPTTERNGVKVIVPIKDYYDKNQFFNSIKEQLAYFQKVYFNVEGIKNDFTIHRNEVFQWSEICKDKNIHICLDDVYYPMDWSKLGVPAIGIPVGLRFSLSDGITPLPNREAIKYTKEAKEIILAKLKLVAEHFIEKYNKQIAGNKYDIHKIFNHFSSTNMYVDGFKEHEQFHINSLLTYSTIKVEHPKLDKIKLGNLEYFNGIKNYLLREYRLMYSVYNKRFRFNRHLETVQYYYLQNNNNNIYIYSDELSKKKQSFLRDTILSHRNTYFIKKDKTTQLGDIRDLNHTGYDCWINILKLRSYPKTEWRERIKEAQYIIDLLIKDIIDLDKIEISKDWIEEKKQERLANKVTVIKTKKDKLVGDIVVKKIETPQKYTGKNCKLANNTVNIETVHRNKKPYIFAENTEKNRQILEEYYPIFKSSVIFILLSSREYKKVKDFSNHNWIKLGEFVNCKHKIIRRVATATILDSFKNGVSSLFSSTYIDNISKELDKRIVNIYNYCKLYKVYDLQIDNKIVTKIIEENLYDPKIWSDYLYVKNILEKHYFFVPFTNGFRYDTKNSTSMLRELCKYHKFRVDYIYKKAKLKEEEI